MNNDYLMHHGIKGQKWGVRRYQNEDGTLTEAGKRRYGNNSSESSNADERVRKISGELMSANDRTIKRARTAAITGLNALNKTRLRDLSNPNDENDQWWFLYEDQTFGLPQIADLANKGYSTEKIMRIVNDAVSSYKKSNYKGPSSPDDTDISGIWNLYFGNEKEYPIFAQACVDYVNKHKK